MRTFVGSVMLLLVTMSSPGVTARLTASSEDSEADGRCRGLLVCVSDGYVYAGEVGSSA